jgi:hypothetical protein
MARASYKKNGRKIHGTTRKKNKSLADFTNRPQRGGENTDTSTVSELEIKTNELQTALGELNAFAQSVNTIREAYETKLQELNTLTIGTDEYNQTFGRVIENLDGYNNFRTQYTTALNTYRTLEAEVNALREAQSLSTSTYEAENFSSITPPTTTAPDPALAIQTVRERLEYIKGALASYKGTIETNRLLLDDDPDNQSAMVQLNENMSSYNNLLTTEYNPNVTRYRELEAQINASQVGSSTTTLQAFETPSFSQLILQDVLYPPNAEISYIPSSTSKLNDYHIMMYMLYLFNNPDINNKLNLNLPSQFAFNNIYEALRKSIYSDPDFNSVFTILAEQINRIKSIPAVKTDIKGSIDSVKSEVTASNTLHVALKREINAFLSTFL